ncbi:translation initiation factor aIF-2 [Thermogymnomonas acidicola]|uniref:Probable translation initiation factor IF-2 n=2 Tax=Thermogymnomonas acidicola TaxID=399579 RepID=A0AA37BRF2_9ARCH|nr:translation initiation factor aIF-2 [Thermogymnomonas acidicola]
MEMSISSTEQGVRYRQPIVCVLGHVDHGKTTVLDAIRGTSVAQKEAGGITQRIGATDIDAETIERSARALLKGAKLKVPGLLFIDTPGHVAFSNMRARGGALADIAVLVIDINEGLMPQTVESINILKKFRTPFIVAANKIDLIPLFTPVRDVSFIECLKKQRKEYVEELDRRIYELVSALYGQGFQSERYDRITDFTRTVAIVPVSGKLHIGMPDLLMMLAGLAQRYLENDIRLRTDETRGTVIEVKREEGTGVTLDTVIYQGVLRAGDEIALNTRDGPAVTRVRGMLINTHGRKKGLREVESVQAAAGVRVLISDKLDVIPGTPMIVVRGDRDKIFEEIIKESSVSIPLSEHGVTVKAEALGSLEAVSYELGQKGIGIRSAQTGDVTKRDIIDVATLQDPMEKVIIAFNVSVLPEAQQAAAENDVTIIQGNIIYRLIEEVEGWLAEKKKQLEEGRKQSMPVPSKLVILPEYIFRTSKPVIVGVRLLSGQLKVGDTLIKSDGRYGGTVKSIRENEVSKNYVDAPAEVAVAIDGVTLNRQINPNETLYVDIPESVVRELRARALDPETMKTLEEIIKIKRKENPFWGTRA